MSTKFDGYINEVKRYLQMIDDFDGDPEEDLLKQRESYLINCFDEARLYLHIAERNVGVSNGLLLQQLKDDLKKKEDMIIRGRTFFEMSLFIIPQVQE